MAGMASTASLVVHVPEPGQLADVRQRRYVVVEVVQGSLPAEPLKAGSVGRAFWQPENQHLVTLSSVEDDALGEELQVIWEIEPGVSVVERNALPAPMSFDAPQRLDTFLNAVRWGAVSSADIRALQAPFRSGVELEDYQLDPVVRAIQMPRANLLIADDVGLGKTIEAGLVAQELLIRHRARKILIVCPAALQIQWRDQMRDKFGLEFRLVDSELMKNLRRERGLHVNPWTHFPRLITSIDFLKRERPLRLFSEILPPSGESTYPRKFDLLIVDEAHNVAPSGKGHYATDSQRTEALRRLVPHFEHKLFLSATPHNGYSESFTALLELLDNQRFARGVRVNREQLHAVMVRRLKSELPPRWDGTPRFPRRVLEPLEVTYTPEEREVHRLLQAYTRSRLAQTGDETEQYAAEFVLKLLKKRLFSSPEAFAITLRQHEESLANARRRPAGSFKATPGILRRQIEQTEEEGDSDEALEEARVAALEAAAPLFHEPSAGERRLLAQMRTWATTARTRPDSKAATLIEWLQGTLKPTGAWSTQRVILFTEYRATQKWLHDLLERAGLAEAGRLLTLYGGMRSEEREQIKAAFQADPAESDVRILLATDAASEGIDLQNHCHRLVHYEIPWNPNRLEQRNGRIDRHGQRSPEVNIYHFVSSKFRNAMVDATLNAGELDDDLEFLMRAVRKVESIREDLGKVGPVIAEQVEEAMLGHRRVLETRSAEERGAPIRSLLKLERRLKEQIDRLHEQLQESRRELHLTPEHIQAAVETALELAGQPPLQHVVLRDANGEQSAIDAFYVPALRGSWAMCKEGLEHPFSHQERPIVFDHQAAQGRDDVVLAHLNHRLVAMSLRLLRAEIWSPDSQRKLARVTARIVPDAALDTPAVIAHGRLVLLGGDNQRLHEELIAAGGFLREGRFARMNVGQVQQVCEAARPDAVSPAMQQRLQALWPAHRDALMQVLEARMHERTGGLQKFLAERAEQEMRGITTVLSELRESILAELRQPEIEQLQLFSTAEREQLERNLSALAERAERIDDEIALERAAIGRRFADPQPRLFPVAVTYLVPERLAR
jgi:superfamily II DNA or RNA helicase